MDKKEFDLGLDIFYRLINIILMESGPGTRYMGKSQVDYLRKKFKEFEEKHSDWDRSDWERWIITRELKFRQR